MSQPLGIQSSPDARPIADVPLMMSTSRIQFHPVHALAERSQLPYGARAKQHPACGVGGSDGPHCDHPLCQIRWTRSICTLVKVEPMNDHARARGCDRPARGGLAAILFLCALVVTMFVGSVWLVNVPWWLALLLAGVSVMVVAGLRFLFLSRQQGV